MSTRSDVFSFSMTMLEVIVNSLHILAIEIHFYFYSVLILLSQIFTGQDPFAEEKRSGSVLLALAIGNRPRRPVDAEVIRYGLNDDMWRLIQDCWCQNPQDRLTMTEVVARLVPALT